MSSVGDLVTNLTVNTAAFQAGFSKAQGIASSGVSGIIGALGPLTGALAGIWGAGASLSAAREDQKAMQKLEAVLAATGGTAGVTAEEIGKLATDLQRVTNFGDEATISAAAIIGTLKNINGDNFTDAIALAQDMATVMGIDLDSAAKKLTKTLGNLSPEDAIKKLEELKGKFGGAAEAVADPWIQLQNSIGDIGEQIGYLLLPAVDALSSALTGVTDQGIPAFESMRGAVQEFVDNAVIQYATLGDSAYLWYLQTELAVVQIAGAVGHFFTAEVPAWLAWLNENWNDVFFTIGDYALTIFINLGENIRSLWKAVLDFFAGEEVTFNWKPLTEGAVNAIKEMPDIPERIKGEFEKTLEDNIAAQKEFIANQQEGVAKEIQDKRAARDAKKGISGFSDLEDPTKKSTKDLKVGALQMGSAEAFSAIMASIRGNDKDVAQQQLAEEEEQNEHLANIDDSLQRLSSGGAQIVSLSLA